MGLGTQTYVKQAPKFLLKPVTVHLINLSMVTSIFPNRLTLRRFKLWRPLPNTFYEFDLTRIVSIRSIILSVCPLLSPLTHGDGQSKEKMPLPFRRKFSIFCCVLNSIYKQDYFVHCFPKGFHFNLTNCLMVKSI